MKKRVVFHKNNGAICLKTFNEKDLEVSSEILVRLVYASDALQKALIEATKKHVIDSGIEISEDEV